MTEEDVPEENEEGEQGSGVRVAARLHGMDEDKLWCEVEFVALELVVFLLSFTKKQGCKDFIERRIPLLEGEIEKSVENQVDHDKFMRALRKELEEFDQYPTIVLNNDRKTTLKELSDLLLELSR